MEELLNIRKALTALNKLGVRYLFYNNGVVYGSIHEPEITDSIIMGRPRTIPLFKEGLQETLLYFMTPENQVYKVINDYCHMTFEEALKELGYHYVVYDEEADVLAFNSTQPPIIQDGIYVVPVCDRGNVEIGVIDLYNTLLVHLYI